VTAREPLFTTRFASLWVFQFATFAAAFQLLPIIPLRILDLGGSKAAAGLFLTVYTTASAIAAPIMGSIGDHVGRRRMLIVASMLFVIFSLAYAYVASLPLVLLVGVIHGSVWSAILSSAGAIMTDFIPVTRRTEGLAYWGLAPTTAMAVAPAVGLFVYRLGWKALCFDMALISAITTVWATRIPGGFRREDRARPRMNELWDWSVMAITLSLTVIAFGYGGVTSYVTILSLERGIKPESLFFTVFAISTIVIRVFTSRLGDRFGYKALLYPALMAMPLSFVILAYARSRAELVAAAVLFGAAMGATWPAFMAFVVQHTEESRRARTFGSVIGAYDIGIGMGSITVGAVAQRFGLAAGFAISAALSCLALPIFMITSRRLTRGTAVAETAGHAGTE
jgi:MFS family permease